MGVSTKEQQEAIEAAEPTIKSLKELGATADRLPNRKERRRIAKARGMFKKDNRGSWKWLTTTTKGKKK